MAGGAGAGGGENALLSAVLAHARAVALSEEELTVAFAATASFPKKKAEDNAHRATVTEALRQLTGSRGCEWCTSCARSCPEPEGEAVQAPRSEEEWVARFKDELDAEELVGAGEAIGEASKERATMPQQKRPNMQQMLQQVQKMQRDMEQAQEALKHETVEAAAGGGVVKVQVSRRSAGPVGDDRPRGGRPRGRRDARRPGAGGGQRGAACRPGARGGADGRRRPAASTWARSAGSGCRGSRAAVAGLSTFAPPVQKLVTELSKLPGIGNRTAQRLAFHILRASGEDATALAQAIRRRQGADRAVRGVLQPRPTSRAVASAATRAATPA